MDSLDLNTRLPPRKRLLAGLKKKDASDCCLSLPIPLVSGELYGRLHRILNNSSSYHLEETIEEVNSVASDAAKAAEAARENAMEKAAAAVKARAAAKRALELVDLIRQGDDQKLGRCAKNKLKKRRIEIKNYYENDGHVETDEELARRLQRTVNSSPRIANKLDHSAENQCHRPKTDVSKKAKVKPKKLLLSQFNARDRGKPEELRAPVDDASVLTGGLELDNVKSCSEPEVKINAEMQEVQGATR